MKNFMVYMIAATLAASAGLAVQGETKAKDALDPAKKTAEKLQEIANSPADESTANSARILLTRAVNDAMTEGRFVNLVENLAKADRDRVGDFKRPKMDDLNKAIAQFRMDFKSKYNQDFEIRPEHFREALVYAGRDKDSATVSLPELQYDRAADSSKLNSQLDQKILGKAVEKGAGMADQLTKAAAGKAAGGTSLKIDLVNEGTARGAWRINIPNEISGDQLKGNLVKHIQMMDDQKAMWPADADAAYHAAAYHVLQAMNDSSLASDR